MLNNIANKKYLTGLLFALSFLLYSKTLNYNFVWDDERTHLTSNEALMKGNIQSFWKKPYSGMYIPVSYTTWTFVKSIATSKKILSPKAFHLLNVLTHSINCILVFLLLLQLFKHQGNAFLGAVLFLLHPLQVESVAWISEFRGLYSTLFSLGGLLVLFRLVEKNKTANIREFIFSKNFAISTILFALALLSKPSAVVLPFVAGVLSWCFYKENLKTVLTSLALWILMILPIWIITKQAQPSEDLYASVMAWQRVFIAGDTLFFYFGKLLAPYPLAACYGNTPEVLLSSGFIYLSTVIYCAVALFLFIKRNQYPLLFSGFAVISICILPVSGLIPFEYQKHSTSADRYMYFAIVGAALWIPNITALAAKQPWLKYAGAAILFIYIGLNIKQSTAWKNEFTLWDHTLKYYQNSHKVYYNRGVEYSKMRKYNEAISDYTKCLLLQPNFVNALFNRANAYENTGNIAAAFSDYNTYLSINPDDGSVYFKRAYLNYRTKNITAAIADTEKAEKLGFPVDNRFKQILVTKYGANSLH